MSKWNDLFLLQRHIFKTQSFKEALAFQCAWLKTINREEIFVCLAKDLYFEKKFLKGCLSTTLISLYNYKSLEIFLLIRCTNPFQFI